VTTRTLTVPVNGDTADEFDEDFALVLSNPFNAALGVGQGTVTITDDDPQPSINVNDLTITEGDSFSTPSAVFDLTLSAPSNKPISFTFSTSNGTATFGSDFYGNPSYTV
jgi:hypothetical protein